MISGEALLQFVVYIVVAGLIFWLLWWLIAYVGLPEPFNKVARVVVAVVAVLFLISVLLGLAGKPVIKWSGHPAIVASS
jgi:predicted tellurium resistance membrane protein TerC